MAKKTALKTVRLLEKLTDQQLEAIEALGKHRSYSAGETIFEQGDAGSVVFCLIEGRVELSISLGDTGEQAPVHTAVEGSVFGEFVLLEPVTRTASARAVKAAEVFAVKSQDLNTHFEQNPAVGYQVMRNLCRILVGRVSKTTRELCSSLTW